MSADAQAILANLQTVSTERRHRTAEPSLAGRVKAIKSYQHARFAHTYRDLLGQPRYEKATRFFLDDLYGPHDFADRDAQFARVVPALVRLFPAKVVSTVRVLSTLHALSEELDSLMGRHVAPGPITAASYQQAWRETGRPEDRQRQIDLMLEIGQALEGYTRSLLLAKSLRMMRGPAHAAGLSSLQAFLEAGFAAFRAMHGSQAFLDTIARREREIAQALFSEVVIEPSRLVPETHL